MEERKNSFRWVVLILLLLNIFVVCLSINIIPPLFQEIGREIPMTKADMGVIMGVSILASLFLSLIGGGISDRVGSRWIIGASIIVVALSGALRSIVGSLWSLTACMFFIGSGLAILIPNVPKVLGMWFSPQELATANGTCMLGFGLAGVIGIGTAAGILSPAFGGWRNVMVALGVFTLVIGILWMVLFKDVEIDTSNDRKEQSILENFKKVFKVKDIWWASTFYGFNMVGQMSVITLLPNSLSERGVTEARAGVLVAIMFGVSSIFQVLGGMLSDRAGKRKPFLFVCAIVFGICIITFSAFTGIPLIIALIIAGASLGILIPVFMVIPVEIGEIGPPLAATAMGLIFMIGNIGGFVGPIIAGKTMDITGAHWPGFLFMGAALIIAGFCILPVRETGQRRKEKN